VVDEQRGNAVEILRDDNVKIAVTIDIAQFNAPRQEGQAAGAGIGFVGEMARTVIDIDSQLLRRAWSGVVASIGPDDVQMTIAVQITDGNLIGVFQRILRREASSGL